MTPPPDDYRLLSRPWPMQWLLTIAALPVMAFVAVCGVTMLVAEGLLRKGWRK